MTKILKRKSRGRMSNRFCWVAWIFIIFVVSVVIIPGLGFWAKINQDEMQILDQGRVMLNPDTEWSMGWLVHESRSVLPASYIGPVLQEWGYQLFLPSFTGTRISALAGAILAATLAFGWLMARRVPSGIALVLALIFLLDPILNWSYRSGRADSWALAAILGALWLLRTALNRSKAGRNVQLLLISAGVLTGIAPFIWPTALVLWPLILVELLYVVLSERRKDARIRLRAELKVILLMALSGLVTSLVAAIPILAEWNAHKISLVQNALIQDFISVVQYSFVDLFFLYDRWILVLVAVALLLRREIGVIIALALALAMMYQTMIYPMRVLYLLPFWMALIGGGFVALSKLLPMKMTNVFNNQAGLRPQGKLIFPGKYAPRRRLLIYSILVLTLVWNTSVSMVRRPLIASQQSTDLSAQIMKQALGTHIGKGPFRVLTTEWDIYPAARSLEWKTFNLMGRVEKPSADFSELLDSMDFAIIRNEFSYAKAVNIQDLENAGFNKIATVEFDAPVIKNIAIGPFVIKPGGLVYSDFHIYENSARDR